MFIDLYQVDAFTNRLFAGNPAGVCKLDEWLRDDIMQSIAIENNLSETAFFISQGDGFHLRWFTPKVEVDLCGHATLASAYVLFNELGFEGESIRFATRSGDLFVSREGDLLTLDFPTKTPLPCDMPDGLPEALGVDALEIQTNEDYVVLLESEKAVLNATPDFKLLSDIDTRGTIITAPGDEVDFVSRFFAPRYGIDEDPVTGSAHCVLVPYWAEKLGKKELSARQVSARGGDLWCKLSDERVEISGSARMYMKAQIELDDDNPDQDVTDV